LPNSVDLIGMFEKTFSNNMEKDPLIPICEFAKRWLGQELWISQRVILKMFAGETLSDEVVYPHLISERQWFDIQIENGRFPDDVEERRKKREGKGFKNILLVIGRRGGKSTQIGVAALYTIYKVLRYPNPQAHYGMQENDIISVAVAATAEDQAQETAFAKIVAFCKKAIEINSPFSQWIEDIGAAKIYFRTIHDLEVFAKMKERGIHVRRASTVQIHAYSSNIDSKRGAAVIAAIFDEFAAFGITEKGVDTAVYYYDSLVPATMQFGDDGVVFILSTPRGEEGKFFELYNDAWNGKRPDTIAIQMPSWEASEYEPKPAITRKRLADDDNVAFIWDYESGEDFEEAWAKASLSVKQEYGAEFVGGLHQWLPTILIKKRFRTEGRQHMEAGLMNVFYVAHADPAGTKDGFAFSIVHKETPPDDPDKPRIIVDHAVRFIVAPRPDYTPMCDQDFVVYQTGEEPVAVDTRMVREYMEQCLIKFDIGFFSFDQVNSLLFRDDLVHFCRKMNRRTQIKIIQPTTPLNIEAANNMEKLVYEDRIECYEHPLLEWELKGLVKHPRTHKVEKGPRTTDDLFDTVKMAALNAIKMPETWQSSGAGAQGRIPRARITSARF
jgi:hypothetical protein